MGKAYGPHTESMWGNIRILQNDCPHRFARLCLAPHVKWGQNLLMLFTPKGRAAALPPFGVNPSIPVRGLLKKNERNRVKTWK
jgi:hypothetical protein